MRHYANYSGAKYDRDFFMALEEAKNKNIFT